MFSDTFRVPHLKSLFNFLLDNFLNSDKSIGWSLSVQDMLHDLHKLNNDKVEMYLSIFQWMLISDYVISTSQDMYTYLDTKHLFYIIFHRRSFSVLTFIKWRLTPSYAAKDTIFWQKRPKTIVIRIIVLDDKNSNLFIWPSMWTRLEHAHCLETINNMWFLGKRESVNAWKKADFDGFREKHE